MTRSIAGAVFDLDRQRRDLAVNGVPPAIASIEIMLAETNSTCLVFADLAPNKATGGCGICSSFDLATTDCATFDRETLEKEFKAFATRYATLRDQAERGKPGPRARRKRGRELEGRR